MTEPGQINCEQVMRVIFTYLDGELETLEERRVAAHLEQCRSCFSRAEFERRLKEHLAALGTHPVPPSLERRIRTMVGRFNGSGSVGAESSEP